MRWTWNRAGDQKHVLAFLATVGVVALSAAVTPASAAEVEFRGGGYIEDFTSACAADGYTDPVYVNAIYRPRKLGSNGASTRFSFFFPSYYAASYELPKGKLGAAYKKVVGGATGTATSFFIVKPRMRILSKAPGRVKASTNSVSVTGQIDNFDGVSNCTATFRLSLQRHP
jgi:hypothetical protein